MLNDSDCSNTLSHQGVRNQLQALLHTSTHCIKPHTVLDTTCDLECLAAMRCRLTAEIKCRHGISECLTCKNEVCSCVEDFHNLHGEDKVFTIPSLFK